MDWVFQSDLDACPCCGAHAVDCGRPETDPGLGTVTIDCECRECGSSWYDVYQYKRTRVVRDESE